jgi:hypothetical protein
MVRPTINPNIHLKPNAGKQGSGKATFTRRAAGGNRNILPFVIRLARGARREKLTDELPGLIGCIKFSQADA